MAKSPSRYRTSTGDEGQYEPGSNHRVLKNLLGIRTKHEIDRIENETLERADRYYSARITTETVFTLELICEIHRLFLGDIYSWGGKIRTVDMEKSGFRFPSHLFLPKTLHDFEEEFLKRLTPVRPVAKETVAQVIATIHAEFLMIHPFREGNGRLARLIAKLMALQGLQPPLYFGFTGRGSRTQRDLYLNAVFAGYLKDYEPLTRFFVEAMERGAERWKPAAPARAGD